MTSALETKIRDLVWEYPEREGQPFLLLDAGVEMGRLAFHEEPAASIGEFRGRQMVIPLQHQTPPASHRAPGRFPGVGG